MAPGPKFALPWTKLFLLLHAASIAASRSWCQVEVQWFLPQYVQVLRRAVIGSFSASAGRADTAIFQQAGHPASAAPLATAALN